MERYPILQENFGDFDVPWRRELVKGWHPPAGEFRIPERPGLGIELDDAVCARHPYKKSSFPSLWDDRWLQEITKRYLPRRLRYGDRKMTEIP